MKIHNAKTHSPKSVMLKVAGRRDVNRAFILEGLAELDELVLEAEMLAAWYDADMKRHVEDSFRFRFDRETCGEELADDPVDWPDRNDTETFLEDYSAYEPWEFFDA